jgi:hypothetical protein
VTQDGGEAEGPALIARFISELVGAEDKRRESLEARGGSVISVSGTLVTLLLGLAALVTEEKSFVLPEAARDRLTFAVVAFVIAVLLAIATYVPQPARITDPTALARIVPDLWERDADFAGKKITATRLEQLASMQATNDGKARALLGAVAAQVVAVALLAWAVVGIL